MLPVSFLFFVISVSFFLRLIKFALVSDEVDHGKFVRSAAYGL